MSTTATEVGMTTARALGFLLATLTAAPALADGGWTPVPAGTNTIPAGGICRFAVQIEAIKNEVLSKTVSTYADGSPREILYKGDLIERITNLDNGRSVVRDSGAFGIEEIARDGAMVWTFDGPIVWGLTGDCPAAGLYAMTGIHVVAMSADGSSSRLLIDDGDKEDLCETLQ
jgi:hypothetical protein